MSARFAREWWTRDDRSFGTPGLGSGPRPGTPPKLRSSRVSEPVLRCKTGLEVAILQNRDWMGLGPVFGPGPLRWAKNWAEGPLTSPNFPLAKHRNNDVLLRENWAK